MSDEKIKNDIVRARVIRRLRKRALFFAHLLLFLVVFGFTWGDPNEKSIILPLFLLWIPLLAIHGFIAFDGWSRLIDRLVQRELRQTTYTEKPKRERIVRLTEDGELAFDEAESEPQQKVLVQRSRQ